MQLNEVVKLFIKQIAILLLVGCMGNAYAVDSSIIYGNWEGISGTDRLELNLHENKMATLKINGKLLIQHKYKYCYCSDYYPFISMTFDMKDIDYHLYLVVGTSNGIDYNLLRGFFEKSYIIDDRREIEKIISYKVDLQLKGSVRFPQ